MNELTPKIAFLIGLYLLVFGCSEMDEYPIPEHFENLESLSIYSADIAPDYHIQLERDQTFGDTDEAFIGWLKTMAVDTNGNVYIADGNDLDIKVYQKNGNYLGSIGQEGDGPGEFRNITSIKTVSGQLVVLDENRQLIQWFSASNYNLLHSVQIDTDLEDIQVPRVSDIFVGNDQSMMLKFSKMMNRNERFHFYSLSDYSGAIIAHNVLELKGADIFSDATGGFAIAMVLPFARNPLVAISKTYGMYVARNHEFLIKEYQRNGEYKRAFYYPFKNSDLIRSDVLNMYGNENVRRAVQNADFPNTWPALDNLLIDDENRLWVSTIVENFDVYEWWVLKKTGELITKFEWPREEPIEVVKNGYMYTRETEEESGLQQIVRYKIEMGVL